MAPIIPRDTSFSSVHAKNRKKHHRRKYGKMFQYNIPFQTSQGKETRNVSLKHPRRKYAARSKKCFISNIPGENMK